MLYFFWQLIKHYFIATRVDVLHSPFVFELYKDCIERKPFPTELLEIETVWKNALNDESFIEQTDYGASGNKGKSRVKTVSHFAKKHAKSKRIAQILFLIVQKYRYHNCVELGTSLGYSTMHLAKALPENSKLTTIEGGAELANRAKVHFSATHLSQKIDVRTGEFDTILPEVLKSYSTVDFAFIDGNHTYEATLRYFYILLSKKNNNSVFVFDDIYWSKGMTQAWEEIKKNPQVSVTVDLYFIGLVFFRREQVREHFKLRVW